MPADTSTCQEIMIITNNPTHLHAILNPILQHTLAIKDSFIPKTDIKALCWVVHIFVRTPLSSSDKLLPAKRGG